MARRGAGPSNQKDNGSASSSAKRPAPDQFSEKVRCSGSFGGGIGLLGGGAQHWTADLIDGLTGRAIELGIHRVTDVVSSNDAGVVNMAVARSSVKNLSVSLDVMSRSPAPCVGTHIEPLVFLLVGGLRPYCHHRRRGDLARVHVRHVQQAREVPILRLTRL